MTFYEFFDKEEFSVATADGIQLAARIYRPKNSGKNPQRLVIHHGYSDHSGRYNNIIESLQKENFFICLFDARGHGNSGGIRGHVDSFATFQSDLDLVITTFLEKTGGSDTALFGHSMGAIISALYAENPAYNSKLNALALSALASKVNLNLVMKIKKILSGILAKIIPAVTIEAGLDPEGISHDPFVIEQYKNDKFVHGRISFSLGNQLLNIEKQLLANTANIKVPVYMFHGTHDRLADKNGSIEFYRKLKIEDKTLKLYDGLFHESFNEFPLNRQKVLNDLKDWLTRKKS